MTSKNYEKVFKQLNKKIAKKRKYIKHNKPKKRVFGVTSKRCRRCGRFGAHIQSYGIHLCRQCFRLTAKRLGFKKYS